MTEITWKTIVTPTPRQTAEAFRLLLAQKGYTSTLWTGLPRAGGEPDVLLTASDGRKVRFTQETQ